MEWRLNHVGQMAQSVQDYSLADIIVNHSAWTDGSVQIGQAALPHKNIHETRFNI